MKNSTLQSYILGFSGAVVLTLIAYLAVTRGWFVGTSLIFFILGLAVVQLLIQLVFFLHLGTDRTSRSNWGILISTLALVLIVIGGSLWIMKNLNYHLTGVDAENEILQQEGIYR